MRRSSIRPTKATTQIVMATSSGYAVMHSHTAGLPKDVQFLTNSPTGNMVLYLSVSCLLCVTRTKNIYVTTASKFGAQFQTMRALFCYPTRLWRPLFITSAAVDQQHVCNVIGIQVCLCRFARDAKDLQINERVATCSTQAVF